MNDNHINCDQAKNWIIDDLKGELLPIEHTLLEAHIEQCARCQQELVRSQHLRQWLETDQAPEPSLLMQTKFYDMLYLQEAAEPMEAPKTSARQIFKFISKPVVWLQVAATIILVGSGIISGYWLRGRNPEDDVAQQQIGKMAVEIQQMRQMMMLTLLDNPSASERLQAVSLSNELDHADQQVIDALLSTLNYDTNINVRLATLDALIPYTGNPIVREGLIQSLAYQESPLVQIALADLMVKLREKRSVKALRVLLRKKGIRSPAKAKVEESIAQLS